jgi:hypothetical protein
VDPRNGVEDTKKRKVLTLPGFELVPLGRRAHNVAAVSTELSRLA